MGRWDDEYEWDYYSQSTPRRVEGGIKAKSERGSIGQTWWSKRWVSALEALGMGNRLTRGRSYARMGQVLSIDVEPGLVKAKVQGSRITPYAIKVQLKPFSDADWERVIDAMAAQALFAAKLLTGEMPPNIEEAFRTASLALFPTALKDLQTDCTCPDWANPCKHIAAVYYILAERFDVDPFLIFKLRGRSKDEIIGALREKRAAQFPDESFMPATTANDDGSKENSTSIQLEDYIGTFWQAGEALDKFTVDPHIPTVDKAVLKRLGDAPYEVAGKNISLLLSKAYDVVASAALRKAAEVEE